MAEIELPTQKECKSTESEASPQLTALANVGGDKAEREKFPFLAFIGASGRKKIIHRDWYETLAKVDFARRVPPTSKPKFESDDLWLFENEQIVLPAGCLASEE